MKVKDVFPENERVKRIVYVVQHKENEISNKIIESKVEADYTVYENGGKHLWGTLHPAAPFRKGGTFQVFRLTNDPRSTGGGMSEKTFDKMLNSEYFHFYDFYVFMTKEAAENYVKNLIENKITELEEQIKSIKHIDYIQLW